MAEQLILLVPIEHKEINGIEMGILEDGTPFLSGRGLANLCDVSASTILGWDYDPRATSGRDAIVSQLLQKHRYDKDFLFYEASIQNKKTRVYPDVVCMSILEYFAFESNAGSQKAVANFRKLASTSLRLFIYHQFGYDGGAGTIVWRQFHDRVSLHKVPKGYFSVFQEMAGMVVQAIQEGLVVNAHTVPDISVGQMWKKHWDKEELSAKYGSPIKHEHNYPEYFPQARSNPQDIWVYPWVSLGDFRSWLHSTYLPSLFPNYLQKKVKEGVLLESQVRQIMDSLIQSQIP